jgi:Arc/MetJ-type ribon-helix-helix transcriptional regulator
MNIALKPDTRKIIKRLIAEGRYASEQEAVAAAVHQLDDMGRVDWPLQLSRPALKMLGEKIKREGRDKLRRQKKEK